MLTTLLLIVRKMHQQKNFENPLPLGADMDNKKWHSFLDTVYFSRRYTVCTRDITRPKLMLLLNCDFRRYVSDF